MAPFPGALSFMVALFSQWCYICSGRGVSTRESHLTVNPHMRVTLRHVLVNGRHLSLDTHILSLVSLDKQLYACDECGFDAGWIGGCKKCPQ